MKKDSYDRRKMNAVYDAYDFAFEMSDDIEKILEKYGGNPEGEYIYEGVQENRSDEIWDEVREVVAKFAEDKGIEYIINDRRRDGFTKLLNDFELEITNKGRVIKDSKIEDTKKESDLDRTIREETEAIDSYQLAIDNSKSDIEKELYKHIQDEEKEHKEELIYFKETGELKPQKKSAEDCSAINDENKEGVSKIIKVLFKAGINKDQFEIKKDEEGYELHFPNIYKAREAYVALKKVFGEEYVVEYEYDGESFADILVIE